MARLLVIEDCHDCCHFHAGSGILQYCLEKAMLLDGDDKNCDIPDWCPLPKGEWPLDTVRIGNGNKEQK